MAWVEDFESRHPNVDSKLTSALWQSIEGEFDDLPTWLKFIDFNERSLVGGIDESAGRISTKFVDELVDAMLGGKRLERKRFCMQHLVLQHLIVRLLTQFRLCLRKR